MEKFSFWLWGTGLVMPAIVYPMDEFLISMAGPMFHLILLPFCMLHEGLFTMNLAMLMVNLLPVLPLDGGRMMKSLLLYVLPVSKMNQICRKITGVVLCLLFACIIYSVWRAKSLTSIAALPLFFLLSAHHVEEESAWGMMRRWTKNPMNLQPGNTFLVSMDRKAILICAKIFLMRENLYFFECDGRICGMASEHMILRELGEEGSSVTFRKIFSNMVEKKEKMR